MNLCLALVLQHALTHSTRLYTTSILLAITSSPIPWTGNDTQFSLIGYSLGGGIVVNFTSYFPSLVSSLVLLAPGGLVRPDHFTLTNKFLYNTGLIP
jgi:alpha-beta hydrolase superfamily lysophospholipase